MWGIVGNELIDCYTTIYIFHQPHIITLQKMWGIVGNKLIDCYTTIYIYSINHTLSHCK